MSFDYTKESLICLGDRMGSDYKGDLPGGLLRRLLTQLTVLEFGSTEGGFLLT